MSTAQIRDIPDEILTLLKEEAENNNLSLSSYLKNIVEEKAKILKRKKIIDEMMKEPPILGITSEDILNSIREGREENDKKWL
mgnify:CR=1 FL=1